MKKLLSLFLAAVLACTSLSALTAFADEAKTAQITLTGAAVGEFVIQPFETEVSSDLSDTYAAKTGFNDSSDEPTMLDAAIALHIEVFGEDFSDYAPFTVDTSDGWAKITSFFGEATSSVGYWNNNVMSGGLTDVIADGDFAYFGVYQDSSYWSDSYVFADETEKNAYIGDKVDITFTVAGWSGNTPAAGLAVTVNGLDYGTTDENGKITVNVTEIDEYHIVAKSAGTAYSFPAYCRIEAGSKLLDYISEQQEAAADFVYSETKEFNVDSSLELVNLIRSGYDVSGFAESYAQSVKRNLDSNSGKLISSYSGKENLGLYGAVIISLEELGYDPTDFYGYDIEAALDEADIEEARPHQYHYKYAIETAKPDKAKAIIQDMIDNYYVLGSGMHINHFFCCDNTCHFLISIAPYADEYSEYVNDAKAVIKTYLKETGSYCDSVMAKDANADSTALSMAAFASVGDMDTAYSYYKLLVENFEDKTGIFTVYGEPDNYATRDALLSLYYLASAVEEFNYDEKEHIYKYSATEKATCVKEGRDIFTCVLCDNEKSEALPLAAHTVIKDRAVAPTFKKKGKTAGSHCSVCGTILTAQKAVKKLGKAKLKKLKKGKKAITVKWRKVKGVDGYQIQYSLKKSFKKKKTVNIKKAKTVKRKIKKLKSNKKYYVRIRAYKVINGKKEFSAWSKVKAVKTK